MYSKDANNLIESLDIHSDQAVPQVKVPVGAIKKV
jgi:hypothetical protein